MPRPKRKEIFSKGNPRKNDEEEEGKENGRRK